MLGQIENVTRISHKNIKWHINSGKVVKRVRAHGKKGQSIWKGKWECMEESGTIEKLLETGNKYKCRKGNMCKE